MDYYDLMALDPDLTLEPSCYVCGTKIEVKIQEVVTSVYPELKFEPLPVCHRCSNAVGRVIELEDRVADLEDRLAQGAGRWDVPFEIIVVPEWAED